MLSNSFHVVKIIDEYTIVTNYGEESGAKKGDLLEIYVPGEQIIDPLTKEPLDTLDLIKGVVEVHSITPKMSVCKSQTYPSNVFSPILEELGIAFVKKQSSKLNIDFNDISGGYPEGNNKIKIGDFVRISKK